MSDHAWVVLQGFPSEGFSCMSVWTSGQAASKECERLAELDTQSYEYDESFPGWVIKTSSDFVVDAIFAVQMKLDCPSEDAWAGAEKAQ